MKPRKKTTGFRAFVERAFRFVFLGVPVRNTRVTVAQIRHGSLLAGRRVLVTGGTRGLGAEFVRKFLSEGKEIPDHFGRPEVLTILRAYYEGLTEKVEIKMQKAASGATM